MRFSEFDLFGVYVAPIAPMMLVAWLALLPLRRLALRLGVLHTVWHPNLFVFALYAILLSAIVLLTGVIG
ncbi:MAG TPA: DUF1656 domain-containing protein [Rhodopila sp.]|uniref:DUF1656 domain-containing protein n=1 Tax=Rhodopila sp. TaxID=2480087 RepID=UPI002C222BF7|nr:DUF1656 domain-containing protein [Rhodopila sp.]HVY17162.1 DUF1656 domain-containing protein [Rhodopila sp.]